MDCPCDLLNGSIINPATNLLYLAASFLTIIACTFQLMQMCEGFRARPDSGNDA